MRVYVSLHKLQLFIKFKHFDQNGIFLSPKQQYWSEAVVMSTKKTHRFVKRH